MEKQCNHCKQKLNLEKFGLNKTESDGHARRCKDCHKKFNKTYRKAHLEVYRRAAKSYALRYPEKIAAKSRKYYELKKLAKTETTNLLKTK